MRKTSLDWVEKLAIQDARVIFIGSDLGFGTLDQMKANFPERFFMEGVSEQHIVGMAAGLAMEGFIPFINTIATFLTRRCFEQVCLDLCLHDLPVRLIANGGGCVYAPLGPTHLAIEDLAIMRSLPNMTVVAPCDADEMGRLMQHTLKWPHPIYIRLAKGGDEIVSEAALGFEIGKGINLREGKEVLLVSTGIMAQRGLRISEALDSMGISTGLLHLHTLKPLDTSVLLEKARSKKLIVTLEEHSKIGGLGSAVLESINDFAAGPMPPVLRFGLSDQFIENYGSQDQLLDHQGLSVEKLTKNILNYFR